MFIFQGGGAWGGDVDVIFFSAKKNCFFSTSFPPKKGSLGLSFLPPNPECNFSKGGVPKNCGNVPVVGKAKDLPFGGGGGGEG